jgi:spore maturation protein CgeB
MRFVIFTHSLVSDWNHGNAHFLRGVATELLSRGHDLRIFEPANGWSRENLLKDQGPKALEDFARIYPGLRSTLYDLETLDLNEALLGADVVIVHEWSPTALVARVGQHHLRHGAYSLFFHDTHHRSRTNRESIAAYDLTHYDGVLAYGAVIRDTYLANRWARAAWTWHEAADIRVFRPTPAAELEGDVVWIGNWGDEERAEELRQFLIEPVRKLGLKARVYGVRYPGDVLAELAEAHIEYGGWLPNFRVPEVFGRYRFTVHVPRRPYAQALPGIPTIRPFEALACGIPMISAPWNDSEHLFRPGTDFLVANTGDEMVNQIRTILSDEGAARSIAEHGLETIRSRHTCSHRVDQLLKINSQVLEPAVGGRN